MAEIKRLTGRDGKVFLATKTYPKHLRHKVTFAGTPENPIALDTYENLYKNLDDEFYRILAIYSWHKSGLYKVDIDKIPYSMALGLKYLIEYNEVVEKTMQFL